MIIWCREEIKKGEVFSTKVLAGLETKLKTTVENTVKTGDTTVTKIEDGIKRKSYDDCLLGSHKYSLC